MGTDKEGNLSSFQCYNCNEKNFFDKTKYINEGEIETGKHGSKSVEIKCKSCREINNVIVEF
jgi:hypothetical protein